MATAVASKPLSAPTKMKKPSIPMVLTNGISNRAGPSPSSPPSSATKRLPGQAQPSSSVPPTPTTANSTTRQNRRLQRITTRAGTSDSIAVDRKNTKKYPEPYVPSEAFILRKHRGRTPSLIVHLHPTHFRFDQQDGSFSYHSEMRIFIEHLQQGTIPHDMIEEFRKSEVPFYDGWLIVRVLDHRSSNKSDASGESTDDGKLFSIHNYSPYITPSPYAPYPVKESAGQKSPNSKQDSKDATQNGDNRSDDTAEVATRSSKAQPKIYTVALRPTNMSRHADFVLDALAPDPKSLNRKQSQANSRSAGGAPPTPVSGVPPTPLTDKGPPAKKQKMKIDAKDLLEYEARIINATAPPLYLEAVKNIEEAERVIAMLRDPHHDQRAPSPKSRKRTIAELAADDAHAKEQERFMLIMDERHIGNASGANAGNVDANASANIFQPHFGNFNTLDNIKRTIVERKHQEDERKMQEDQNRRNIQEQEVRKREMMIARQQKEAAVLARNTLAEQAHQKALQQTAAMRQQQQHAQGQASSIPPQMQSQMMAAQQRSSPVIRHGTPQMGSSPVINNQANGVVAAAGSPARPGSAVQHGHPMARGPSAQGPSRNGTPQIPNSTPGMRNATPVMRQGTPAQHMSQASPRGSMMAPTPQMAHAMQGQAPNGMQQQYTSQQMQQLQQQRQAMQHQAAMQQQMMNGNPAITQAHMAHMQAQQAAMAERNAAQQRMQQQQQQQSMSAQGTPQQMSATPASQQMQYKQGMADAMKAQIQSLQGSPAPNHMNPNQQAQQAQQAQMAQQHQQRMLQQAQQQQHQNAMMNNMGAGGGQQAPQQMQQQQGHPQQQRPPNPQIQAMYQALVRQHQARYIQQAAVRYGGNTALIPQQELSQMQQVAKNQATAEMKRHTMVQQMQRQQAQAQAQAQQQGGVVGGGGQGMPNGMQGGGVGGGNMAGMNPGMQQAMQQQQAQQMQQMQMRQASAMIQQQQQGMGQGMQGGYGQMQGQGGQRQG